MPAGREGDDGRGGPGAHAGATISYVAIDGAYAGTLAVADPPAPGAREAVAALRALGIEPRMISGDREAAARAVAGAVGIERCARASARRRRRRWWRRRGRGTAWRWWATASTTRRRSRRRIWAWRWDRAPRSPAAAADVTLLRGGIASLPAALELARATLATIRRNLRGRVRLQRAVHPDRGGGAGAADGVAAVAGAGERGDVAVERVGARVVAVAAPISAFGAVMR